MKTIISTREAAIKWWNSLKSIDKLKVLNKYNLDYSELSSKQIESIYLQQ